MRLLRPISRKGTNLFLKQDEDNSSGNDQYPATTSTIHSG